MTHLADLMDWVARILALGSTGVGAWFLQKKWKTRGDRRLDRVTADEAEATSVDRIRTSSVTAAEAQIIAADRAFGIERDSLNRTIVFLQKDNADLRDLADSKDEKLQVALRKIEDLQAQLTELAEQVRADLAKTVEEHT